MILAAVLGFLTVCAIPATLAIQGNHLFYTNSAFSVLLWVMVSYFLHRVLQHPFSEKRRKWVIPYLFSFLLSVCLTFGSQLEVKGQVDFLSTSLWGSIVVLTVVFAIITRFAWERIAQWRVKKSEDRSARPSDLHSPLDSYCGSWALSYFSSRI